MQRHVPYLGKSNTSQAVAWHKAIDHLDEDADGPRTLAFFPEDRCERQPADELIVRLRLPELQLSRQLQLVRSWADRPPASRKGTR